MCDCYNHGNFLKKDTNWNRITGKMWDIWKFTHSFWLHQTPQRLNIFNSRLLLTCHANYTHKFSLLWRTSPTVSGFQNNFTLIEHLQRKLIYFFTALCKLQCFLSWEISEVHINLRIIHGLKGASTSSRRYLRYLIK